jgi:type II secretory pathway pseudopilin PulG
LPVAGFSLPELLLVLLLSAGLAALILQALSAESRAAQRLGQLLRERQLGLRALELVRQELLLAEASSVELRWDPGCSLAGRRVALQLQTTAGVITYSQGPAPSAIWRGAVLMRCGPAYGLAGELSGGQPQNRVLLDGLPADAGGLALIPGGSPGVHQLLLERQLLGAPPLRLELPVLAPVGF